MIERLLLMGATGDLVERYITPALVGLREAGELPDGFEMVGVARDEWDTDGFRSHLEDALEEHAPDSDVAARTAVLDRVRYHRADSTDADALAGALEGDGPIVAYLALPPAVFADTLSALDEIGLPDGSRVVAEKPFGEGLESARELNDLLHRYFAEDHVHRVDHFLGMHTVQNLLGLRFGNRLFEPVWSCDHIERVDIVWDETLTLEGRAGYFDGTGMLKDMLQNHLLQVLALIAMDAPATLDAVDLRDRKAQLLRDVRRMEVGEAAQRSARARYTAGSIGDREVPAYVDEEGVDPEAGTETFAEVELTIDSWRWAGVPFRLRAGKALGQDRREVVITFRDVPHAAFGAGTGEPNQLRIALEPESLSLRLNVTGADGAEAPELEQVELSQDLADQDLPAYAHVLRAILQGDPTLSIRDDEAISSWEIMTPVLQAWDDGEVPLQEYAAGSDGP